MTIETKKTLIDPSDDPKFAKQKAEITLSPSYNAGVVAEAFSFSGKQDLTELRTVLIKQCSDIHGGSMKRLEYMLLAQAHSLDVVFASLARRAIGQDGLQQYEVHMKLALRAQNQCRATLETLAGIKNPPIFAKQANIAHGAQQVNNESAGITRVEESKKTQTKLLEHDHEQGLDSRTAATASGSNPAMATVEAVHRPKDRRRKRSCAD